MLARFINATVVAAHAESCPFLEVDMQVRGINNLSMFHRRSLASAVIIPLIIGLAGLTHLMSQPGFAAIRAVDVVQMTGSGMCFGVALFALIALLRTPRG